MKTVYLGLGSNLGDRDRNLDQAIERLSGAGIQTLRRSSIYETAPRDVTDQPWFLNIVIEANTRMFPRQLLSRILQIEAAMGRRRINVKGPRIIDIDILLYGRAIVNTAELTIPHPGLLQRRFVLEPLAELAPTLRHPCTRERLTAALAEVNGQEVLRRR